MVSLTKLSALSARYAQAATGITILEPGTKLYHGTFYPHAEKIKNEQALRGNLWSWKEQQNKSSSGTMEEQGLIWFFPETYIDYAKTWALGPELGYEKANRIGLERGFADRGAVFTYIVDRPMKLIDRGKLLTNTEAAQLEAINPRKYDPITPDITLSRAMYRLIQGNVTYKEALPAMGYDGITYDEKQYGILADSLKISGHEEIEMSEQEIQETIKRLEEFKRRREAPIEPIKPQESKVVDIEEILNKLIKDKDG